MPSSLYIGRFQPFHLGHLDAIHQALATGEHLLIGIGSAEQNFLPDNPFTAGERFQMIQATLAVSPLPNSTAAKRSICRDNYTIIPIRNINNYALWINHLKLYLPPFHKVYTGSKIVRELFETYNQTQSPDQQHPVVTPKFNHSISATQVRTKILNNDSSWQQDLPQPVVELLNSWNATERIKNIQG